MNFSKFIIKKKLLIIIIGFIFVYLVIDNVYAETMPPTSIEEAITSDYVIIAEYVNHTTTGKIDYMSGTTAKYRVKEILKGSSINRTIIIKYLFHDLSPCMPLSKWDFKNELMPEKGSEWILFLKTDNKDLGSIYHTYRGDYGRWEANDRNVKKVSDLIISTYGELSNYEIVEKDLGNSGWIIGLSILSIIFIFIIVILIKKFNLPYKKKEK